MDATINARRQPWNKGKLVGQKAPLKVKDIWAIRIRLQIQRRIRDLALSDRGIDSKPRGCDLVKLRVRDVCHGDRVVSRAMVLQQRTHRPVQFEITPSTRDAIEERIKSAALRAGDFLFPSRPHASPRSGTRQYARVVDGWVPEIGWDSAAYGAHSIRRTKPTLILLANEEPQTGGPWPHEARKHREIPWRRGRRRSRNCGADRGLARMAVAVSAAERCAYRPESVPRHSRERGR